MPNPFKGLPNPREVWAWGMYDLANQSFTLLIITLLFALYFKQVMIAQPAFESSALQAGYSQAQIEIFPQEQATRAVVDGSAGGAGGVGGVGGGMDGGGGGSALSDADFAGLEQLWHGAQAAGDRLWSALVASSLFVVVVVSPILGALGDARQWRKEILLTTGVCCAVLTCALGVVPVEWGLFAGMVFLVANICYQVGENFLASFLPDVSTPRTIGRISATGWTMGYVGALALLLIVVTAMQAFGLGDTARWRPFFVLAGVWFLLGMIPCALFVHERKRAGPPPGNVLMTSFARLGQTLRHAGEYRQLAIFLGGFFVFGFGVQTVINFASIIANDFGIRGAFLAVFVLQLTATAGIAAVATARYQDRFGAKLTVLFFLAVWIASTLAMVGLDQMTHKPQWVFWVVGNGIGLALGGIGTSSRSLVGKFTPRQRAAEFFGLWGLTYKLAGAIGVLSFGLVKAGLGNSAALLLLTGFFVVGGAITLFVSETRGLRAAQRAQRNHNGLDP